MGWRSRAVRVVGSRRGCGGRPRSLGNRDPRDDRLRHLRRRGAVLAGRREIRGPRADVERPRHCRLDRRRDILAAQRPPGEHRHRQDRPDRVRDSPPGDVGRGAVDGLVHPERPVLRLALAERRRRQQPQAPREDRRLVRQDVAEEVLRDDDVEPGRALHEQHRARIHELVVDLDVRELGLEVLDDLPPEPRGRDDVGLVDARQAAPPGPGELEAQPDDAPDLGLRVRQRVPGDALPGGAGRLLPLPEVDATGELPDDQQVDAGEELRPERRRRHERRVDRHRPEVCEQLQLAAEREQALLRANGRGRVVPLRPAQRAQQDRVAPAGPGHVLGPDRDAVRVDGIATGGDVRPGDVEPERLPGGVQNRTPGGDDLRPDPVPRDRRDAIRRHEGSSTTRGATNATATPLISAPWSLFTPARYASSEASMMFVLNPWPETTSAPAPSSDERRQRTRTWPWASSPAETALISYSVSTGCQPKTGWRARSTAEYSASTGPFPTAAAARSSPFTASDTLPVALPPCDDVTFQPRSSTEAGTSAARCSTSASRS